MIKTTVTTHIRCFLFYTKIKIRGAIDAELKEVQMIQNKKDLYLWEAMVKLTDGEVIFTNRKGHLLSWRGTSFPSGKLELKGFWDSGIVVSQGTYKVLLNFNENKYQFIKIEPK